jgi:4-amino-4-deoxy-L-arabinose transferase-like glycosyltransferase
MHIKKKLSSFFDNKTTKNLTALLLLVVGIFVLISAMWNGYISYIDNDELAHTHMAYLIAHGTLSYRDFFASVYTPLFHWFLIPFLSFFGYQVSTIPIIRIFMIGMYLVRLGLIYALVKQVFNQKAALVALVLCIWDPFMVFNGMSIRPDNLMLTFFLVSAVLLTHAYKKAGAQLALLSGGAAAFSVLLLPKIAPSVIALTLALCFVWHPARKKILPAFVTGGIVIGIGFFLYLVQAGIVYEFWQQAIIKSVLLYEGHVNPVPFGFFYQPNNTFVYGLGGRPIVWVFACMLPLLGAAGWYHVARGQFEGLEKKQISGVAVGLLLACFLQGLSLLAVPSVFIQYYLPVTYLFAIFAAVAITDFYTHIPHKQTKRTIALLGIVFYLFFSYTSIQANGLRGAYNSDKDQIQSLTRLYARIPPTAHVFPSALFRPLVFPVWYGLFWGDIPYALRDQYPDMLPILQNDKVEFVLTNEYEITFYPPVVQAYIRAHYQPDSQIESLWIPK